ncbi:MAG: peptide ABC transporter substrate-binding protein [Gemmatimonadaceae bacterium]
MMARFDASIVAVAIAALLGCGPSPRPADVVVYASGTDLESANPLVTIHPLSRQVQRHVLFVTLFRYDSVLVPQPYYARAWTWSADRRSLSMSLEPTLHWHDGTPTTAHDVAYTVLTARDSRTGFARATDFASVDTVIALSDTTLVVRFKILQRDLPSIFAELPIVPAHRLRSVAPADMRRAAFSMEPVGNGPFRFVDRRAGQRWRFERNARFPASMGGAPRIRELVVAVVDEPTTKFAGLAAGDLDFAGIAPTMAALAERDPAIEVMDYPVLFSNALVFNVHRAPFDDVRVRRAVDLSIDRKRLIEAALAGFGTPASGPVPPENPLALRAPIARDAARADSLLDAAGWKRGRDGWRARERAFSVELLTVGSGDNAVEQLIQADLAERGIRLEIRQLELAAFLTRARAKPKAFDLLVTGVPGDLSLAYLRAMFESGQRGSSLDYADFHSRTLDTLFAKAQGALSEAGLRNAWREIQAELARQAPVAWLYHSRGLQGVSSRMRNVRMDLRGELVTVARWTTGDFPVSSNPVAGR